MRSSKNSSLFSLNYFQMNVTRPKPLWLLAELTYRCPLQCPYCTNPIDLYKYNSELTTEQWFDVLQQSRELGSVQLGLSGGEPLVRKDLELIIEHSSSLGFYSNLITTGIGLTEQRVKILKSCGLDHIQLSIQDKAKTPGAFFNATKTLSHKKHIAKWIKNSDYPMVVNIVLHRNNLDQIETLIQTAIDIGADFIELANAQYHGWAFKNKNHLIPSKQQLQKSEQVAKEYQDKYQGKVDIFYVVPDYYEGEPKPCMSGWGNISMTVAPNGDVLPCLSAAILPEIQLPNVKDNSLQWIWNKSSAFNKYRGEEWMLDPCKTCPKRSVDYGGCRCQAYLLTGDARNADPACKLSAHHGEIKKIFDSSNQQQELLMRNVANSKKLDQNTLGVE